MACPTGRNPAEGLRNEEAVPASEDPGPVYGDVDRYDRGAGELCHADQPRLDDAPGALRAVYGMDGEVMLREVLHHGCQGLPPTAGAGPAHGAEVEAAADVRDQFPIPAPADHRRRGEFAETPGVGNDEHDPLMPEGGNRPAALPKMAEDLFIVNGMDPDHKKIEAQDPVGERDQAIFDGESGQGFDHGPISP